MNSLSRSTLRTRRPMQPRLFKTCMNILSHTRRRFPQRLLLTLAFSCIGFCAVAFDLDPVLRGRWPLFPRGPAYAVAVQNGYAFVAAQSGGLVVIDVRNAAHPHRVGGCCGGGNANGIAVLGHYAYLTDNGGVTANGAHPEFVVIDISDPANPQQIGSFDQIGDAQGVVMSGRYAYVTSLSGGLQVIDVSNPSSPQLVGGYDTSGYAGGIALSGHYAYVADDFDGLLVIDVGDPVHPQLIAGEPAINTY